MDGRQHPNHAARHRDLTYALLAAPIHARGSTMCCTLVGAHTGALRRADSDTAGQYSRSCSGRLLRSGALQQEGFYRFGGGAEMVRPRPQLALGLQSGRRAALLSACDAGRPGLRNGLVGALLYARSLLQLGLGEVRRNGAGASDSGYLRRRPGGSGAARKRDRSGARANRRHGAALSLSRTPPTTSGHGSKTMRARCAPPTRIGLATWTSPLCSPTPP